MNKRFEALIGVIVTLLLICSMLTGCTQENAKTVSNETGYAPNAAANLKQENIQQENIMGIVKELSSEKYGGRLTGTKANRMAAQYIAEYFKTIGLENPQGLNTYMQLYTQPSVILTDNPMLQIVDKKGKIIKDFNYVENFVLRRLSNETNAIDMEAPMYLIERPELLVKTNKELEGKVILVPWEFYELLGSQNEPADFAEMFGAKAVISEFDLSANKLGYSYLKVRPLSGSWMTSKSYKPFAFVDSDTFSKLAKAAKSGSKLHFSCNSKVNANNIAVNVLGLIPGNDPELKDNCIIIGAHFDHVGDNLNGTYNPGALDNASGTAAMMELARVIKESKTAPKQSILFIAFDGEESGLNGARYYCSNPVTPLEKAVMINMDMVGSAAKVPLTIAVSSKKSDKSLRDDLAEYADKLTIAYNKEYEGASDHAVFDCFGIPAVCLINMDVKYGYHSPHDTIEAVDGDRVKEIAGLVLSYIKAKAY